MPYKKAMIYYWSGTGNTLRISKWAFNFLKNKLSIVSISSVINSNPDTQTMGENTLLLIAMPTHGFTAPWQVIKFCLRLPMGKKTAAVTIANGAGTYPGFYLPGFSASANSVISFILLLKGYRVRGFIDIDMPGSWPAFCPGLNREHADHFLKNAKRKTEAFIKIILSGEKHIINFRNVLEFIFGMLLIPVSFGYIIFGRFFFAKLQFANLKCNSCGTCAGNCSQKAILMKGKEGFKKPYWTFKCESCGKCISYCPQQAVETGHSMAILIWYILSLRVSFYLIDYFFQSSAIISFLKNKYIFKLLNYMFYLLTIFVCYYVLYYMVKIPLLNKFFSITSGTHWWKKYHEPSIKIQDFKS
ncbi:MAG: EFR1 family ferrodoxin [Spirochaetes bacterium]|jgi:ferredoxin|nr:EFR1 family ferrodoxin [Spirochaetota bacterium]